MKKKYLFGLLAAVAMVGCSDDNGLDDKGTDLENQTGKDVYLTVNIMDASSLTRATGGDPDSSSINGTHDEHTVTSADFYFYDEEGIYVSKANVWRGGNDHGTDSVTTNSTYEYYGNSVVVLKGLKETSFPKYMVTVLNTPAGFTPGTTLDEMEKVLSTAENNVCYKNGNNFIMTTTSYKHKEECPYFVTTVNDTDFRAEPVAENFDAIEVYVERLAAKVTLKVDNTQLKPVSGKTNVYEIEWTVAGGNNKEDEDTTVTGIGAEKLYVSFEGWGLNATAKYSYMMKNIDESWTNGVLGFVWNRPALYRSYWGKSYNYGKGGYPTSANDTTASSNDYLNYVSYNSLTNEIDEFDYCAENTNTLDVLKDNFGSAVTSILLKAKITTNAEGEDTTNFVSYQGMLFKEEDYLAYVLKRIQHTDTLNVWYKVSDDPETYRQLDRSYVTLQHIGDAKTKVQLDTTSTKTFYRYVNDTTWNTYDVVGIDSINSLLGRFNESTGFDAIAYKGGMMYYNIPIEHLNNNNKYRKSHNVDSLQNANYGVVRNHLYEITINSLKNPGHGVYDPDEVIVPGPGTQDDELYYVGAQIRILPWKIVKQDVDL